MGKKRRHALDRTIDELELTRQLTEALGKPTFVTVTQPNTVDPVTGEVVPPEIIGIDEHGVHIDLDEDVVKEALRTHVKPVRRTPADELIDDAQAATTLEELRGAVVKFARQAKRRGQ